MSVLSDLVSSFEIPPLIKIRQHFPNPKVNNPITEFQDKIQNSGLIEKIKPGQSIAITAGSRGIKDAPLIYRELVSIIKEKGAKPFIIPAMGSHGGSTKEGQLSVLNRLGVTEEFCGCPIISSMETDCIGYTKNNNLAVNIDHHANKADGIILVNRIKPHTSFRGELESGLAKISVIGLGKQKGAEYCHSLGMKNMSRNIREISDYIIQHKNILFGIGILENAKDETAKIVCLKDCDILKEEPALLKEAFSLLPQIYFYNYDILILDQIGKEISGTGMDCNIISRYTTDAILPDPRQKVVTVLDLSDETHGNAHGMGLADISTKRFFEKIDFESTYANPLTALSLGSFKMPMILESDRVAIQASIKLCAGSDRKNPKIVRAKNTMDIENLMISKSLLEEARKNPNIEILSEPQPLVFDMNGNLNRNY